MHEVLVNRLGGLSLPRKSVVRLTDRLDMTLDVYRGRITTMQQQQQLTKIHTWISWIYFHLYCMQARTGPKILEYGGRGAIECQRHNGSGISCKGESMRGGGAPSHSEGLGDFPRENLENCSTWEAFLSLFLVTLCIGVGIWLEWATDVPFFAWCFLET